MFLSRSVCTHFCRTSMCLSLVLYAVSLTRGVDVLREVCIAIGGWLKGLRHFEGSAKHGKEELERFK